MLMAVVELGHMHVQHGTDHSKVLDLMVQRSIDTLLTTVEREHMNNWEVQNCNDYLVEEEGQLLEHIEDRLEAGSLQLDKHAVSQQVVQVEWSLWYPGTNTTIF